MNSQLRLIVNEKAYTGWQDIQVEKSLSALCGAFQVKLVDTRPVKTEEWPIRMGDSCAVYIDDLLLVTGYIEDINLEYDNASHSIVIAGRDKLGDLVDCYRAEGQAREWVNQSSLAIIKALCSPFAIEVVVDPQVAEPLAKVDTNFGINDGDTVFETIRRLINKCHVLAVTHGDGRLLLTRTGTERAAGILKTGANVLRGTLKQSNKDRFSTYYVKGTSIGEDLKALTDFVQPHGKARDQLINRYRPLVIIEDTATSSGECALRAIAESAIRAGNSRVWEYDVAGWKQPDGTLWKLNQLVQVYDPVFGTLGDSLLAEQIRFVQGDEGQVTSIQLCSPQKYIAQVDLKLEKTKTKFDPASAVLLS